MLVRPRQENYLELVWSFLFQRPLIALLDLSYGFAIDELKIAIGG